MATTRKTTETVTPEAPKGLFHKLHSAKQHIGKVAKNATNPHFKKTYADINALLETVEPILLENGLILLQPVKANLVFTQIIDIDSGESIESCMEIPATIVDPQKTLACITYFRRGTLQSLLSLQSIDDDGNEASGKGTITTFTNSKNEKPTIDEERFKNALKAIADGKFTVDKLKATYSLTPEQINQLK
jgi:hypothetical protein